MPFSSLPVVSRRLFVLVSLLGGCTHIGPGALNKTRASYNEAVKKTSEQEMLLNIVRLRYGDTPSSLAISNIAGQYELNAGLSASPFAVGASDRQFLSVLPGGSIGGADRPTISFTPLDDSEFARRLFTPLSLEGIVYLAKTTWPIQTVFRLYLENLNWVPNAQTASGPTPALAPPTSDFLDGMRALQVLQQRGDIVFGSEEPTEPIGPATTTVTAADLIAANQQGLVFVAEPDGRSWRLNRPTRHFVLHVNPAARSSPELLAFAKAFRLDTSASRYVVTLASSDPFDTTRALSTLDLETRSLLQALYFVAHGVEVPADHLAKGLARQTKNADGSSYDWAPMLRGLFVVKSTPGGCGTNGRVAVEYSGSCFFIDETDHDTLSTFSLLMELARLELSPSTGRGAPVLTIPLGR